MDLIYSDPKAQHNYLNNLMDFPHLDGSILKRYVEEEIKPFNCKVKTDSRLTPEVTVEFLDEEIKDKKTYSLNRYDFIKYATKRNKWKNRLQIIVTLLLPPIYLILDKLWDLIFKP